LTWILLFRTPLPLKNPNTFQYVREPGPAGTSLAFSLDNPSTPIESNDCEGHYSTSIRIVEELKMPIDTSATLYILLAAHAIVGAIAAVAAGLVLRWVIQRLMASWRSMEAKRASGTSQVQVEGPGCALPLAN
jgi:hypothetical protein